MSFPSTRMVPWTRALGANSCMRLKQRMYVLLPQPEGPMSAVTEFFAISIEMPLMASLEPYHAETLLALIATSIGRVCSSGVAPGFMVRVVGSAIREESVSTEVCRLVIGCLLLSHSDARAEEGAHDQANGEDH